MNKLINTTSSIGMTIENKQIQYIGILKLFIIFSSWFCYQKHKISINMHYHLMFSKGMFGYKCWSNKYWYKFNICNILTSNLSRTHVVTFKILLSCVDDVIHPGVPANFSYKVVFWNLKGVTLNYKALICKKMMLFMWTLNVCLQNVPLSV